MAKKKEKKPEVKLERQYNVPLRREWLKVPLYKRSKKAVSALNQFLSKHMKADMKDVKIGPYLNEKIWERGIRFPPHHVKVNVKKDSEGIVKAELVGAPIPKEDEKKAKKAEIEKKIEEAKADIKKETTEKIEEKIEEATKEKAVSKEAAPVKDEAAPSEEKKEEPVKKEEAKEEKKAEEASKPAKQEAEPVSKEAAPLPEPKEEVEKKVEVSETNGKTEVKEKPKEPPIEPLKVEEPKKE